MLKNSKPIQQSAEFVSIEDLVPKDYLLRKIDQTIDFNFIEEKVKDLYYSNDDYSMLNPIILFKILFIGYFFGIKNERKLIEEIQVNIGYRWFLGYNLTDKILDSSTLTQIRRRCFKESNIFLEVFDEIILKVNDKYERKIDEISVSDYFEGLDKDINNYNKKVGRNEPCPCGSGKKYKKCCG